MIDTHYHLDALTDLAPLPGWFDSQGLTGMIVPAMGRTSLQQLLALQKSLPHPVYLAAGLHPERPADADTDQEIDFLADWIGENRGRIVAVGEVGLPHYSLAVPAAPTPSAVRRLIPFLDLAAKLDLPVILHAVHEQAPPALKLLRAYGVRKAVFHWLKASPEVAAAILAAGIMCR